MIEALRMLPSTASTTLQGPASSSSANAAVSFASQLADTVRAGESAVLSGIKGEMPLQQVVETVMHAERTLTTAISIRDKVVSAYLEMTRMQI